LQGCRSLQKWISKRNYAEVTAGLAHKLKADEKLIAIRHIYTNFGAKSAKVVAYLYHDEAKKAFFEPKAKEKKAVAK
jgi:ribosomal protein S24E